MITINRVEAHNDVLDVDYDPCQSSVYVSSGDIGDGYLEKWYELTGDTGEMHIPHNSNGATEIRYYVSPVEFNSAYTWTTARKCKCTISNVLILYITIVIIIHITITNN